LAAIAKDQGILADSLAGVGLAPPPRVFAPMVLTDTGAKLSKSLIREGKVPPPPGAHPWMLDVTRWPGDIDSYIDAKATDCRVVQINTSDLKRAPVYRLMTRLAEEQRTSGITWRRVSILNVLGMRAQESPHCALLDPFSAHARTSNATVRLVH
jgi:hypothetical protein